MKQSKWTRCKGEQKWFYFYSLKYIRKGWIVKGYLAKLCPGEAKGRYMHTANHVLPSITLFGLCSSNIYNTWASCPSSTEHLLSPDRQNYTVTSADINTEMYQPFKSSKNKSCFPFLHVKNKPCFNECFSSGNILRWAFHEYTNQIFSSL